MPSFYLGENVFSVSVQYNTTGVDWDYDGHRVSAAIQVPIVGRWKATLMGDAYWQDFNHTHTIFNVKRSDNNYTLLLRTR